MACVAELEGLGHADRARPVLERTGRIAAFVLEEEPPDTHRVGQARNLVDGRPAHLDVGPPDPGRHGEQFPVAPHVGAAARERVEREDRFRGVVVVARVEDALRAAHAAGLMIPRRVRLAADDADECGEHTLSGTVRAAGRDGSMSRRKPEPLPPPPGDALGRDLLAGEVAVAVGGVVDEDHVADRGARRPVEIGRRAVAAKARPERLRSPRLRRRGRARGRGRGTPRTRDRATRGRSRPTTTWAGARRSARCRPAARPGRWHCAAAAVEARRPSSTYFCSSAFRRKTASSSARPSQWAPSSTVTTASAATAARDGRRPAARSSSVTVRTMSAGSAGSRNRVYHQSVNGTYGRYAANTPATKARSAHAAVRRAATNGASAPSASTGVCAKASHAG